MHRQEDAKKGRGKSAKGLDPLSLPAQLQTALEALYGHYRDSYGSWEKEKTTGTVDPTAIFPVNGFVGRYALNAGTISLPNRRIDLSTRSGGMRPTSWLLQKMS